MLAENIKRFVGGRYQKVCRWKISKGLQVEDIKRFVGGEYQKFVGGEYQSGKFHDIFCGMKFCKFETKKPVFLFLMH